MRPLEYQYNRDRVAYHVVDKDGNRLLEYVYVCFASIGHDIPRRIITSNEAKYIDFYLADSASDKRTKRKKYEVLDLFLEKITPLGLLRNAEITRTSKKEIKPTQTHTLFGNGERKLSLFRLRFDLDKVSGPEIFFVGNLMRTISLHPYVVEDFLALCEKHPEVDTYSNFLLAHKMGLAKDRAAPGNHSIVPYSFKYITSTPEKILQRLDEFFAKKGSYKSGGQTYRDLRWDSWLVQLMDWTEGSRYYQTGRKYTPELFNKSLNETNYNGGKK